MFTVVMALVGLGTLYEIIEGGSDTHDLAVHAKEQADKMKDMSEAADKIRQAAENMVTQDQRIADNAEKGLQASSKQSKAALDASIASSRQDERAWLGAGDETYTIAESGPIESSVSVANTGKSPALDIICRITGRTKVRDSVLVESDIVYPPEMPILKEGTIFPSQHFPLKAGGPPLDPALQKTWFDGIQSGAIVQYFFGEIRYKDTFGRDHWTHFCTRFIPSSKSGTPCPIYNDTDDSKKQKNPN